jgi:hypothetical protein
VLGLSATPGSVVLDVRPGVDGSDRIVLHRVAGRPAPEERAVFLRLLGGGAPQTRREGS